MAMKDRLIRVTFNMPDGPVVLAEDLMIRVRSRKTVLTLQNRAIIEIGGMAEKKREFLMSNFTAFNKRQREQGVLTDLVYISVKIEVGYRSDGVESLTQVFIGQVAMAELAQEPPNMIMRITAYTRMLDNSRYQTSAAPSPITFKDYCIWAGKQMQVLDTKVNTSIDNLVIYNPGRTSFVVSALIWDIQNYNRNTVVAYIDDDILYVKDKDKILSEEQIANVDNFIGVPTWDEYGVEFNTLFDPSIALANGVRLKSIVNPGVNDSTYIITELNYDLSSRDNQFFVRANASPSAQSESTR